MFEGENEPPDGLIDLASSMCDDNVVKHIEWFLCAQKGDATRNTSNSMSEWKRDAKGYLREGLNVEPTRVDIHASGRDMAGKLEYLFRQRLAGFEIAGGCVMRRMTSSGRRSWRRTWSSRQTGDTSASPSTSG